MSYKNEIFCTKGSKPENKAQLIKRKLIKATVRPKMNICLLESIHANKASDAGNCVILLLNILELTLFVNGLIQTVTFCHGFRILMGLLFQENRAMISGK